MVTKQVVVEQRLIYNAVVNYSMASPTYKVKWYNLICV